MGYSQVQGIAKETIDYIKTVIKPGMTLTDIRRICEEKMKSLGADSFWYWDVGAFCFSGDETTISVSGKGYKTSDKMIGRNDIITIDLSPQRDNIWGDYARTIILEDGIVVESIEDISNTEWRNGLLMEEKLHMEMKSFVTKSTTFEELYFHMNDYINKNGYINLDFIGNLGHSIVKAKDDRVYIEKGNSMKLSEAALFTFEPHISIKGSKYGYKKENIYYFAEDEIKEL
ncbi:MAG: M24 family metallopeptidase [Inconstantimicrobium porci]|uniref:M24 family metallopeptidase n=1 Tax=Inconstantimicrobium porci TaxID=2652291 RepID=UPI002A91F77F|nr:M24 family metallopeptidase [Inconstantimicrobium porci]MDY5911198.1 M24 family metallopeptidase [Inconstantimicrobium porci]